MRFAFGALSTEAPNKSGTTLRVTSSSLPNEQLPARHQGRAHPTTARPVDTPFRPSLLPIGLGHRSEVGGVAGEEFHARTEAGESRIGRLAPHVAEVNLLDHDRDLEDGENLEVADVRDVTS